jgi:CPA2 family monovalent cation:H+ antiporter-2
MSPVLASMVLSMLATPFIDHVQQPHRDALVGQRLAAAVGAADHHRRKSIRTEKHVIICGYGRSGQNLARMLEHEGIPYMALDLDPDRVRQAAAAGQSVVFGDAARLQALMAAGLARASAVVVTYHDTPSALKILAWCASTRRSVPVIVRTIDDRPGKAARRRRHRGGARGHRRLLMLASHALALVGVPMRR